MRRAILLAALTAAALAHTALPGPEAPAATAQSGQDRLVVFEAFQREN